MSPQHLDGQGNAVAWLKSTANQIRGHRSLELTLLASTSHFSCPGIVNISVYCVLLRNCQSYPRPPFARSDVIGPHALHTQDPIAWSHFDAEGEISFKSLIYIPATTPPQVNDLSKIKSAVKLFVRKVCASAENNIVHVTWPDPEYKPLEVKE
jgi:hypothetical protein